jgi:hypothetical protein
MPKDETPSPEPSTAESLEGSRSAERSASAAERAAAAAERAAAAAERAAFATKDPSATEADTTDMNAVGDDGQVFGG